MESTRSPGRRSLAPTWQLKREFRKRLTPSSTASMHQQGTLPTSTSRSVLPYPIVRRMSRPGSATLRLAPRRSGGVATPFLWDHRFHQRLLAQHLIDHYGFTHVFECLRSQRA